MASKLRVDAIAPFSGSVVTISGSSLTVDTSISASVYYGDGSNLTGVGGGGTGYPNDIRPNSTVVKAAADDVTTIEITADTATSSLYLAGTLYSPSNTVQVVSSSTYATASIIAQSYVNNTRFNFTLSSSLGAFTGSNEAIQLAVQSAGFPDDGPQTLIFIPGGVPVPLTILSCSLWLDADDAATMTLNGSTISDWRNKATDVTYADLFDFSQSVTANQPTRILSGQNLKTVVRFDGNDFMGASGSDTQQSPARTDDEVTIFGVCRFETGHVDSATYIEGVISWTLNSTFQSTGTRWFSFGDYQNSVGRYFGVEGGNPGSGYTNTTLAQAGNGFTEANRVYTFRNQATTPLRINGDGGLPISNNDSPLVHAYPDSTVDKYLTLGREWNSRGIFSGDVCEIICYARNLTNAECDTVEEYLADKWGITL